MNFPGQKRQGKMAKKKSNPKPAESAEQEPAFEDAMEELEGIVRRLESGGSSLEEALTDYSNAIHLMKLCHTRLESVERRVSVLSGIDADGNPVTEAFADEKQSSDDLDAKRTQRSKRRSAKTKDADGLF